MRLPAFAALTAWPHLAVFPYFSITQLSQNSHWFFRVHCDTCTTLYEARSVVILSLLIPIIVALFSRDFGSGISDAIWEFVALRLVAIPSITLDHYFVCSRQRALPRFDHVYAPIVAFIFFSGSAGGAWGNSDAT